VKRKVTLALFALSVVFIAPADLFAGMISDPQTSATKEAIDWTKLDAHVLDEGFDWIDAASLQASVLDKPDIVYLPREADAERLQKKLQRADDSDANKQVYLAVVSFAYTVGLCRIANTKDQCSWQHLHDLEVSATASLKDIRNKYRVATHSN
jgi:hypothetical protein